jgi:hypothetical protein
MQILNKEKPISKASKTSNKLSNSCKDKKNEKSPFSQSLGLYRD